LDVVSSVVTGRRVLRAVLILLAAYFAYKGVAALVTLELSPWSALALIGLGAVILAGYFLIPAEPAPAGLRLSPPMAAGQALHPLSVDLTGRLAAWRGLRPMLALFVAAAAQVSLFGQPSNYWAGLALWAAALALWYPALRARPAPAAEGAAVVDPPIRWRWAAVGGALGLVAFLAARDNQLTPLVTAAWLLGTAAWVAAMGGWRPQPSAWPARAAAWLGGLRWDAVTLRLSWTAIAVAAILALGAGLRFYRLNDVPREMTSDHVEKLMDVDDVLNGHTPVFFIRNTGREPFQFYYTAALIRLLDLPLAHIALKVGTALAGSVTLIFVFLMARELAGAEVGLWTMLLAAISRWPIALSRAGLRYPFAPLFAAPAFYFLARGLKSGRRSDFVWAGLFVGLGLQGYSSYRVVPLVILAIAGLWLLLRWRAPQTQQLGGHVLVLLSTALVTCLPLVRYMLDRPDMFWYRVLTRLSSVERPLPEDVVSAVWQNLYRVFLMFNYTRDAVWTVNIANWPTLAPLLAGLFGLGLALGLAVLVVRALRRDVWAGFVLIAWVLLLMPSALSLAFPQENPSVARAGIVFPFVFLIAAWPLAWMRQAALQHLPGRPGRVAAAAGLALIVGLIARTNFRDYFVTFRDQYALSATNPSQVAAVVRGFTAAGIPPEAIWLKGYPHWLDARALALESFGTFAWRNAVLEPEALELAGTDPGPKLFIVHVDDQPAVDKLRELYPNGILARQKSSTPGKDFLIYFVPPAEAAEEQG
jgi:hypothetical protein